VTEVSAKNRLIIEIDRELCYGFGDCVSSAPEVFDLDNEDKAVVIDPDGLGRDDILQAAQNCPVDAIILVDEDGGQLFP
jgi:ferredoxin